MKKLPQIYQGSKQNIKTNNKKQCIVDTNLPQDLELNKKIIDSVFSGLGYPFNILLEIKTKNSKRLTSLISKNKDAIITIDNEIIPFSEIISITRKKN